MKAKKLYDKMTFNRLMITMAKLKSVKVGGNLILMLVTRAQKDKFDAFGIAYPRSADL